MLGQLDSEFVGLREEVDSMGYRPIIDYDAMDDLTFLIGTKNIKAKFSLRPRKCNVSGKSIWFKMAYRVRHTYRGWDLDLHYEDRWYSSTEYVILRLKA